MDGFADGFDPGNNFRWGVIGDIISPHMENNNFGMSWDLSVEDSPQDIFNFIASNSKIVNGISTKLQKRWFAPKIGD